MTKIPFREHHLYELLRGYDEQTLPLDLYISFYFRDHKALGSKDRGYIAENAYALIRWKGLLDHYCDEAFRTWESRFAILQTLDIAKAQADDRIPQHVRLSFPQDLYQLLVESQGIEKAQAICMASNYPAPTTVRANALKITREALLERWKPLYEVIPCEKSPYGITFLKKLNFFTLPEFTEGLFEVQDEGSQLLADLVQAQPGQWVLDYCAGSGGKTLALAPQMQGKGQIFLHDIRAHALLEARKRLKRAGIQNAQAVQEEDEKLKKLKKKMDWVLVDAPCTGTGTLRRNPDMKWKFDPAAYKRLVSQQRVIFEKALSYLKPGGHIVYATCSLLQNENQKQLDHFLKTYPLQLVDKPFISLPSQGGMDGFFGAVCRSKDSN